MKNRKILNLVLAALFLALAYVLPFLTGQIPAIGNMLCPMHVPVLLCGFICGWYWGLGIGLAAPLLRSVTLGMPALFPQAICMSLELAAYGAIAGLLYKLFPKKLGYIYLSLISAMLAGRLIWGAAMLTLLSVKGSAFGLSAFFTSAFVNAIPGIIIQIALIPPIVRQCEKIK